MKQPKTRDKYSALVIKYLFKTSALSRNEIVHVGGQG
jgi:hypothetical protein